MLELEVGISGFEGCVSFLGFPPRKPSWLRKPRTPRDARVTMPCALLRAVSPYEAPTAKNLPLEKRFSRNGRAMA